MVQFSRGGVVVNEEEFEVLSKYQINEGIGFGTFGFVAAAVNTETGEEVAIKKFKNVFSHPRLALCAVREILLLSHFHHDNIIQLKDLVIPVGDIHTMDQLVRHQSSFNEVYIVLKKYDMNLRQLCENKEVELDSSQRSFLMYQLLRGMKCIHSARVIHRDLKPDNVLMSCEFDLAICDFGSGRGATMNQAQASMMATLLSHVTTQWYRAPEGTLSILNSDGVGIDEAVQQWVASLDIMTSADVWSIGCIMAELMLREPLFKTSGGEIKQLEKIFDVMGTPIPSYVETHIQQEAVRKFLLKARTRDGTFKTLFAPEKYPTEEVDLLERMLHFAPEDRITIEKALEHPYLKEWHCPEDEPTSEPFILPCDGNVTVEQARDMIWQAMVQYHPEVGELEKVVRTMDKKMSGSALKAGV
jgi:serine/threonine protein kinase